jgi:tetratricopeptide (TPR) repeat protein/predicted Ser/Thr protein kinase
VAILELAPEDGEHIGPYRIVRLLGRGGMGEVFLCWDPDLQRSVAIKRIRHDSELGPTLRQRLLREAQTAGSLHHPSIVVVYHLLKCAGDDCIVMEYVEGQTLAEALRDGPLELKRAVGLAKEVAAGLAVAHAAGIIHRDLKAENVMITPAQAAKILDFGLAKPMGIKAVDPALTATGHVVGTRRSMSPEQLRGAEVDGRSDLFSLGVLLYEMLTGSSPFQGVNAPAILCQMFRSGAPPRLVALLERLLAQDPAARFQTAAEVVRELEAIAAALSPPGPESEETLSALPTETMGRWGGGSRPFVVPSVPAPALSLEEVPQPRRRHLSKVGVIVLLSLLVAGAILFWWYTTRPKLRRIFVAGPELIRDNPQDRPIAASLQVAVLNILGSLKGIAPIDPSDAEGSPRTPREIAQATAANDILIILPEREGSGTRGWINLRLIRDGQELTADRFPASLDPQATLEFNKNLDTKVRALYPDNPSKPSASPSANFLNARLRAADEAIKIYQSRRDTKSRDRAFRLIEQAEAVSQGDFRPLQERFLFELAEGELGMAAITLSRLEDLMPSHTLYLALRVQLEEAQEWLAEALSDQLTVVEEIPSWTNLLTLAKLEERQGLVPDARRHLGRILKDSPDNTWAKERLAELELDFGDPEAAEKIYRDLIAHATDPISNIRLHDNLGAALVLLHRYKEAIGTFSEALAIDPKDINTLINMADSENGLCQKDRAHAHYEEVLQLLKSKPSTEEFDPSDETIKAQCLAQLGDTMSAVAIVARNLRENPDDATLLQTAALVFTLAGNNDQAIGYIERAIEKGYRRTWFTFPPYAPLFRNQKFKNLMAGESLRSSACQENRAAL